MLNNRLLILLLLDNRLEINIILRYDIIPLKSIIIWILIIILSPNNLILIGYLIACLVPFILRLIIYRPWNLGNVIRNIVSFIMKNLISLSEKSIWRGPYCSLMAIILRLELTPSLSNCMWHIFLSYVLLFAYSLILNII